MDKKQIYKEEFGDKEIARVSVQDESVVLHFTDETFLTIETYHDQDCCESVYGDFSAVKAQFNELPGKKLKELVVKSVSEMGFLLNFKVGWREYNKIFVACYNSQNGYYSSNLSLRIKNGETTTEVDISDAVEDQID